MSRKIVVDIKPIDPDDPEASHFCRPECASNGKPCHTCLAGRRRRRDERLFAEAKPTLRHQPFATLLRRS